MRETNARIARVLPVGNPLRELVLKEPDFLPIEEARVKFESYLQLVPLVVT